MRNYGSLFLEFGPLPHPHPLVEMKRKALQSLFQSLFALAFPVTLALLPAQGADQTYLDSSATNTWNTTDLNWDAGVAWANNNTAIFGGTGETVAVGTVTANGITFNSTGYTLSGGTISLGAASTTITTNADATITSLLAGGGNALVKEGTGMLTIGPAVSTFTGATTVNNGILNVSSPNNGDGGIRGTLTIGALGTVRLSSGNALGWNGNRVSTLNINGGLLDNVTAGDNLWGITINMTGGELRSNGGVSNAGATQLFSLGGGSAVNTLANATQAVISGRVQLREGNAAETLTFNVADGAAVTDLLVSASITESAVGRKLAKTGAGTMSITNPTGYTGGTIVNGGTLLLGYNSGGTGTLRDTLTINSGATVGLSVTNALGWTGTNWVRNITITGGTLRTDVANVDNGWGTTINLTRGTMSSSVANGYFSMGNAPVFNVTGDTAASLISANLQVRDNIVFNVSRGSDVTDLNITGSLFNASTGGITKNGTGIMLLNGPNTYTGVTTVNGGTLAVDGNGPTNRLAANRSVVVNNTGVFEIRGVNALPTAGNSTDVTVNTGGVLRVVSGTSAALPVGQVSHAHLRNLTLAGGTVELTYSGTNPVYDFESFQLNGDVTVNGSVTSVISSSGSTALTGIALAGNRTFTVNDVAAGTDLTVSAELENSDTTPADDGITKAGAGTMLLQGSHSYSGATNVNAGTLSVATGATIASSSLVTVSNIGTAFNVNGTAGLVTVNAGAILSGNGTVGGLTLNGTVSPGNSAGILTTGAVSAAASSLYDMEINGLTPGTLHDQLSTMGTISLNGTLVLTLGYTPALNDKVFLWLNDGTETISGTFTGLAEGALIPSGGDFWKISYLDNGDAGSVGNDVSITYIPEPATTGLALLSLVGFFAQRRRK